MDKLKEFIDTNREAFDDDLLPEGHLARFEQKLPVSRKSHAKRYTLIAFAVAACIACILLVRLPGGTTLPTLPKATSQQPTCMMEEEIKELRLYYNMQMNDIVAQMNTLYKQQQSPSAAGLLKETKRVLTDNYMFEETILPVLPCSDDGLCAMNQHYSSSVESLHIMLQQMEKINESEIINQ